MKKEHIRRLKKFSFGTAFVVTALSASVIGSQAIGTTKVSLDIVSTSTQATTYKGGSNNSSDYIVSVLTPDSEGLTADQITKIRTLYSLKPSDVQTTITSGHGIDSTSATGGTTGTDWPANNVLNILQFGSFFTLPIYGPSDATRPPEIYNLSARGSYGSGLTATEALDAFTSSDASVTVSENYLNDNGILALQIIFYTTSGAANSMYLMISGFATSISENDLSTNPVLEASSYTYMVDQLSDEQLLSFPQFTSGSVSPTTTTLVENSRVNDTNEGSISFSLNYQWNIPDTLQFNSAFSGLSSLSSSVLSNQTPANNALISGSTSTTGAEYKVSTNYTQSYSYSGFQPSPNISTEQVIFILAIVIAATVVVCLIVYFASLWTKKVRERKAM